MDTTSPLLRTVLSWPLEQVEAWLEGLALGEPVEGEHFNWELLAFTAAARAHEERSLSWARMALSVYGALAERAPSRERQAFMLSIMNLRASMIREFGHREGDDVLDSEIIVAWFQQMATLPVEEVARAAAQDLHTLPIETLRKLRDLKNALNVVSLLSEVGATPLPREWETWLQLRPRLP